MDYSNFSKDMHLLWQTNPEALVLLMLGFFLFLFLVTDAFYYKGKLRRLRPPEPLVSSFRQQIRKCRPPCPPASVPRPSRSSLVPG